MISGWGLNEQGKKIAKRDLEASTDASGFNRYDPYSIIQRYGADALRYWGAASRLGHDLRYNEKDVKAGRKFVVKLWNVAKLCATYLADFDLEGGVTPLAERPLEDRWLMSRLDHVVEQVTTAFESYEYAVGRDALERFFWTSYCDNYLEIVKDRLWHPESYEAGSKRAAQSTLWESLRILLSLTAPYLPFITEEIYQRSYAGREGVRSIHITKWPDADASRRNAEAEAAMRLVLQVLEGWRFARSNAKLPARQEIQRIVLEVPDESQRVLAGADATLRTALRCGHIEFGKGELETGQDGLRIGVVLSEQPTANSE
jgi:valyl-tRNA synthetase